MNENIKILKDCLSFMLNEDPKLLIPSLKQTSTINLQRSVFLMKRNIIGAFLYENTGTPEYELISDKNGNKYHIHFAVTRVCDSCRNLFLTNFSNKKEFEDLIKEEDPYCDGCLLSESLNTNK